MKNIFKSKESVPVSEKIGSSRAASLARGLGWKLHKNTPAFMTVLDISVNIASSIFSAKAGMKAVDEIKRYEKDMAELDEVIEERIETIKEHDDLDQYNAERLKRNSEYKVKKMKEGTMSREECEADIRKAEQVKRDTTLGFYKNMAKIFALPAALTAGGVVIATVNHRINAHRIVKYGAAMAAVGATLNEYRGRVREVVGEEVENDLYNGIIREEVVVKEVNEKGKEVETKKEVVRVVPNQFSKLYDFTCINYSTMADVNYDWIMYAETAFNRRLQIKGYVFLNEVYEFFGMPYTDVGQVMGWIVDPKDPGKDPWISLGVPEKLSKDDSPDIWIIPNVQGPIVDEIHERGWRIRQ